MAISETLQKRFAQARRVCVLSGAGISAESGVPTFRGGGGTGTWKGMRVEKISSAEMLQRDLNAVWDWIDDMRGVLRECQPNPAHLALAEWQKYFKDLTVITQNIDGLHHAAGSSRVIELHGNINRSRCDRCKLTFEMSRETVPHEPENCTKCGSKVRPDAVLFGEMLPTGNVVNAVMKASRCDLFFVVGTTAIVYPAAMLPKIAKDSGAFLVEVNTEETTLSKICDESLQGKAGDILPLLKV